MTDWNTWLGKRLGLLLSALDKTCFALGLRLLELFLTNIECTDFALNLGDILIYLDECLFDTIKDDLPRLGRLDVDELLLLDCELSAMRLERRELRLDSRRLPFLERIERPTRNDRFD